MDDPNQPQEPTQVAPPAQPVPAPATAYPPAPSEPAQPVPAMEAPPPAPATAAPPVAPAPATAPPPAPATAALPVAPAAAWPPPPAYPPAGSPPPGPPTPGAPPQPWAAAPGPVGPAPGVSFAGHGARLGAYIVDAIILGFVVTAITIITMLPMIGTIADRAIDNPDYWSDPATWSELSGGFALFAVGLVGVTIIGLLYFPFFWARGGATPGMKVAGIRVVNDRDGSRIGWGSAILRLIGWWVSAAVFYLGFIWILIDSRRRGWADLIAGTCVISTR